MREADTMNLPAKIVHVIDREADSVFHLRAWSAEGFYYLVVLLALAYRELF